MMKQFEVVETSSVPFRLASNGFMSKTSTPCILPRISKRSRPVDWSRSVATVPGSAPGGRRSSSVLISVEREEGVSILWECREGKDRSREGGCLGYEGVCV